MKTLVAVGVAALFVRLSVALTLPELDSDAYGHFKLARAFLRDPTNLRVHWVWLPGWHVVLAGPVALGLDHRSVRVALALIQTIGPWLLYRFARALGSTRGIAHSAALFYSVAPLPNLLATSAQTETLFSLLLLGAAWALARERGYTAGALLGVASLFRYEAWGVVAWLGARSLLQPRRFRFGLIAFGLAGSTIGLWLGLRHLAGLPWFSFARGTQSFVERYREAAPRAFWESALRWVALPWVALGPALLLTIPGIALLKPRAAHVPAGVLGFLLVSALGGGLLALPRYLTALTPFACIGMAAGAAAWSRRRSDSSCARATPSSQLTGGPIERRVVACVTVSLALLAIGHVLFALTRVKS